MKKFDFHIIWSIRKEYEMLTWDRTSNKYLFTMKHSFDAENIKIYTIGTVNVNVRWPKPYHNTCLDEQNNSSWEDFFFWLGNFPMKSKLLGYFWYCQKNVWVSTIQMDHSPKKIFSGCCRTNHHSHNLMFQPH